MPKLFIPYRRDDTAGITGRIYDRLVAQFGGDQVVFDVDSFEFGQDFREALLKEVKACDVLLVVIGPYWLQKTVAGQRALDRFDDFVRIEIESAMNQGKGVLPICIGQTPMPRPEELPFSIQALSYRNAISIDLGRDFHHHVDRLISAINRLTLPTKDVNIQSLRKPNAQNPIELRSNPRVKEEIVSHPRPESTRRVVATPADKKRQLMELWSQFPKLTYEELGWQYEDRYGSPAPRLTRDEILKRDPRIAALRRRFPSLKENELIWQFEDRYGVLPL